MNINNDDSSRHYHHDVDPLPDHSSDLLLQQHQRRPRGFAAAAASTTMAVSTTTNIGSSHRGTRKEREKEKERTKLRERHRRAITSRMLAGLRQYGNFPLPTRADMNDVLAALAREAGWTVETDGTTFRPSPPSSQLGAYPARSVESPLSGISLKNCSALDFPSSVVRIDESLSPASLDSVVVPVAECEKYSSASPINSQDCLETNLLMQEAHVGEQGYNFLGTTSIPVYVMLGTGLINKFCQLVDHDAVRQELRHLKALHVDGVFVDCWWGIIEARGPQKYDWSGYRELFNIIHEFEMKLQVGLSFHEYGGSGSGEIPIISLPQWVLEIGKHNEDIFFTDQQGRRNTECLSWSVDKERVLKGRTGVEVYFDVMRSFRTEFDDMFVEGLITAVEIGLGASGELKYPSFSERMGWRYPGIGEFQCYDKYSQQNLYTTSKLRGHTFWARGPENAGNYNSSPHETGFFSDRGDYDSYYGRFFLQWYSQCLIDHADTVLCLASLAFEEIQIVVKIPAVYWWYKARSHAAELTAGYYNPANQDGYSSVFEVLKKYSVAMKFVFSGLHFSVQEIEEALGDPEGLSWQVLNSGWDGGLCVGGQNGFPSYDKQVLMRIVESSKPKNDPDGHHHLSFFIFQQPLPLLETTTCFSELDHFIKCMHGENVGIEI